MLVSISIIKLIINLLSWYYYSRSTVVFQDWKYSGAQFDELENVYKIIQK